jgi:hypothetical protein
MTKRTLTKLFVGYVVAVLVSWIGVWGLLSSDVMRIAPSDRALLPVVLMFAAAFGMFWVFVLIGLGIWVYRDARQRGMEPLPWALIAVLVPYFIGVIVYLVVRHPETRPCSLCGQRQPAGAAFCASCGHALKEICAACKAPLPPASQYCAACGTQVGAKQG